MSGEPPSIQVELCHSMDGQRWVLEWKTCMYSHCLLAAADSREVFVVVDAEE